MGVGAMITGAGAATGDAAGSARMQPAIGSTATKGRWDVTSCEPCTAFTAR